MEQGTGKVGRRVPVESGPAPRLCLEKESAVQSQMMGQVITLWSKFQSENESHDRIDHYQKSRMQLCHSHSLIVSYDKRYSTHRVPGSGGCLLPVSIPALLATSCTIVHRQCASTEGRRQQAEANRRKAMTIGQLDCWGVKTGLISREIDRQLARPLPRHPRPQRSAMPFEHKVDYRC